MHSAISQRNKTIKRTFRLEVGDEMDGTKFQKESGMPYKEAFIGTRCQLCILRHIEYISICLYIFHLLLHNLMISHYISAKVQLVKRESAAVEPSN